MQPGAEPGAEPGAGGFKDTLNDDYDNSNIRTDINMIEAVLDAKAFEIPYETKYNSAPALPYKDHPYPSLQALSNKFRQKGPNKIMYPPKNGPVALIKKYGGDPNTDLPPYDPFDELTREMEERIKREYAQELRSLCAMQYRNELQNIRALARHESLQKAQSELASVVDPKYKGIFIGDMVVRGPDWKWGNQDGGLCEGGSHGTIRGIRQWHPQDMMHGVTEAVVLWDHGLYGNYRFNYRGAYDVRVVSRMNAQSIDMEPVCVGDTVCRRQKKWRWGDQDGGIQNDATFNGTILELYASPAPFEGGARIAVCWDKDKQMWREKAKAFREWKEMEQKENEALNDLCLDKFEYVHISEDSDNDNNNNNNDDAKQSDMIDIEASVVNASSTGKGVCLVTCGIQTDDPWSLGDDYKQWNTETTANWIRELNDSFDEYGDTIEQCDLNGTRFEEFAMMSFWINKINVIDEAHAKALATACKYRTDQYETHKTGASNECTFEEEAPPAFDIPIMDETYLSPHLRVPQDSYSHASGSDNEGGEGAAPGFTDDEGGFDEPIAAPAAFAASNNTELEPNRNRKRKKQYFWQKVMRKEEELMKLFAEKRAPHEYFHITHGQYGLLRGGRKGDDEKTEEAEADEEEYEWKEPDFDELLSKPIAKYRWGIQYNYDLQIDDKKAYASNREYLMIDDRVKRGKDFSLDDKVGNYKSDFGIVLKIEQWDDTRIDKEHVRGDKIYLTWSSFRPFRFNYNGAYDIEFFKRGQVFAHEFSHIRVGDTVSRGFSWTDDVYHNEDGGEGKQGIVVAVQYVLQVTGIIAKVIWHKNNHINLYSWGFKKVYDVRRV